MTHGTPNTNLAVVTSEEKRAYHRAWYQAHKEEMRERARARHQARLAEDPVGTRAKVAAKARARRAKDPERQREYDRAQYQKRKDDPIQQERIRARTRDWKERNKHRVKNYSLKAAYGITLEQWEALFDAQGRKCAMCRTDKPGSKHGWHTDHDYETGAVRGILCRACNLTLGYCGDTLEGVAATTARCIAYLRKTKP